MTDQTTETARALLYRYGLPEDVIDGALCLHAQELAAVQREFADQEDAHLATTSASVYVQGIRDGADRIDPMRESAPSALLSVSEARTRLLQALDASYCQALGHTPEGLLAAYEASRTQTVDQAALSAKLWEIAERHIVAEWICCEPLEPGHDLCAKGYEALGMVKSLLVDADPGEAWNPSAPLLSVLAAVLPATTDQTVDRAVVLREAADEIAGIDFHPNARARSLDIAAGLARRLRRMADETAATATQPPAALSPTERTMLDYALNVAQLRMWDTGKHTAEEQDALVSLRRLTAEQPAAGARQDGAQP